MKHVTESTFSAEVLEQGVPVIVKFEAAWCAPCKAMTPLLTAIAADYGDKVVFVAANVEQVPLAATRYGIRQIPALVAFKDGVVVGTKTGASTKSQIETFIKLALPGANTP